MLEGSSVPAKRVESRRGVVIRFAGDSGDGMQLTGSQFTAESALAGNDLATLPDFPAEIRAPAGTLAGVSAFQLHFAADDIFTPGDDLDVLVAMNPAALRMNLDDLRAGGILIVDREAFNDANLRKAGYSQSPLDDGSLERWQLFQVDITKLTTTSLKGLGLSAREEFRCRNFFCLGIASWLFHRPIEVTEQWIEGKFKKNPKLVEANRRALRAGFNFAENAELLAVSYEVPPATIPAGTYRNITGNTATALGLVAAAQKAGLPIFLGSYPITPGERRAARAVGAQAVRRLHLPGRGRDRRHRRGPRRGVRRRHRRHDHQRPRHGPQVRDDGPGAGGRAATHRHRHPARRTVHRHAHEDRAGGPADGAVRPTRRGAAADRGALHAVGLLRRRRRGGAHRGPLHDAGHHPDRRLPRQRRRAVADPGPGEAARHPGAVPDRPAGLLPVPARRGDAVASVGAARHARSRAPHRRPVEGGRHRQRQLRAAEPRADGAATRPQDRRHRARPAAHGGVRTGRSGDLLVVGWGSTFGAIRQAVMELQRGRQAGLARASPPSEPAAGRPGRHPRPLRAACSCPRSTWASSCASCAPNTSSPAIGYQKIQGRPFKVSELVARCTKLLDGDEAQHDIRQDPKEVHP